MTEKEIKKLLNWYSKNKRDLPWRHTKDSYKIWISEIMLQQTRVEAVKLYYERFLSALPTIKDLAKVKEDVLLKLWEGLGYYSRAKNLKKCAEKVIELGLKELPQEKKEIEKLPGIGPYTAGAILSIAYGACTPAIDGNVLRVLARIHEDNRDLLKKSVKEEYETKLKKFMTKENARDFTESLIELGALVCVPNGQPKCEICPFLTVCKSKEHNTFMNYPVKSKKKKRKVEEKTVYILTYDKKYVVKKRGQNGLLKGLYELPNIDKKMSKIELKNYLKEQNYQITQIKELKEEKHIFSHIEWHMKPYVVILKQISNDPFYSKEEIEEKYSLPTAFKKIFQKIKE